MCFVILIFRVSIKESSVAKLGSVCRRVYRIFSHAYFHHRTTFDEFEVMLQLIHNLSLLFIHACVGARTFLIAYNNNGHCVLYPK
jgi:hypothetical protein